MIYGYARISTPKQSIERQIRNIKAICPDAVIVQEAYTGTKIDREQWNKLTRRLHEGDTIIFDSVSRMSRNADEGVAAYEELYRRGIELVFLKEHYIDTATYKNAVGQSIPMTGTTVDLILEGVNSYLLTLAKEQIRLAFEQAEKEVTDLRQRTKEGIETARLNGEKIGRIAGSKHPPKRRAEVEKIIRKQSKDFGGTLDDADVMKLADISRNTFYKYKRELKQSL